MSMLPETGHINGLNIILNKYQIVNVIPAKAGIQKNRKSSGSPIEAFGDD